MYKYDRKFNFKYQMQNYKEHKSSNYRTKKENFGSFTKDKYL